MACSVPKKVIYVDEIALNLNSSLSQIHIWQEHVIGSAFQARYHPPLFLCPSRKDIFQNTSPAYLAVF